MVLILIIVFHWDFKHTAIWSCDSFPFDRNVGAKDVLLLFFNGTVHFCDLQFKFIFITELLFLLPLCRMATKIIHDMSCISVNFNELS